MTIENAAEKRGGAGPVSDAQKQINEVVRDVLDYNFPAEEGEAIIESILGQDLSTDLTSTTQISPDLAMPVLPEQNRSRIPEFVRNVFNKPKVDREEREEKEIKRMESAIRLEKSATRAYLKGQITSEDYQLLYELTSPITKLDLRKLAQHVRRGH